MKVKRKAVLSSAIIAGITLFFANAGFTDVPAPPANQTFGIDDGIFSNMLAVDCRVCHDDTSVVGPTPNVDRHHLLYGNPLPQGACSVNGNACLSDGDCDQGICSEPPSEICTLDTDCNDFASGETCGEVCIGETAVPIIDADQDGTSDTTYGCLNCHGVIGTDPIEFGVERDCLVCHTQVPGEASVHHLTGTAQGTDSPIGDTDKGDCTPCHGDLVDDIGDGHAIRSYEPSTVTPSPSGGEGQPLNGYGNGSGACDYCHDYGTDTDSGVEVFSNADTHHNTGIFLSETGVTNDTTCTWCHNMSLPSEYAIRTCEGCHGFESLHNIALDSNDPDTELIVGTENPGYSHVGSGDDCWGCHGFASSSAAGTNSITPFISSVSPMAIPAGSNASVTLTGQAFTNVAGSTEYISDVSLTAADGSSVTLTPDIISQGAMTVTIPGSIATGNYNVQAVKGDVASNPVVLSIKPEVEIADVICSEGILTITGSGFADAPPEGAEEYINVEVDGVPVEIISWTDTGIEVAVSNCSGTVTVNALYGSDTYEGDNCQVCNADVNQDGRVDLFDLIILISEFLRDNCDTTPCQADCNGDGSVDLWDLIIMKIEFLKDNCCL